MDHAPCKKGARSFSRCRRVLAFSGEDLLVQGDRFRVGPDAELVAQDVAKALELTDRSLAIARLEVGAHQAPMRLLVGRIEL
jgi:hypothetical protein